MEKLLRPEIMKSLQALENQQETYETFVSFHYNVGYERFDIHVHKDSFIDLAEELNIAPDDVDVLHSPTDGEAMYKLSFIYNGMNFFLWSDDFNYRKHFADWLEPPMDDEEFIQTPKGVTRQEVMMKQAGHKQSDFL